MNSTDLKALKSFFQKKRRELLGGLFHRFNRQMIEKLFDHIIKSPDKYLLGYELDDNGSVNYYHIMFEGKIDGHKPVICCEAYCSDLPNIRRKFYRTLKANLKEYKNRTKLKVFFPTVFADDRLSQRYFAKFGRLSGIQLLGHVSKGLRYQASKRPRGGKVKLRLLKKEELEKCLALESKSHKADPTSRMNHSPISKKAQRKFYNFLLRKRSIYVAVKDNRILGAIGLMQFKNNPHAMIGTVFVNPKDQGQGIGNLLYYKFFSEAKKRGLKYYAGYSTTERVLKLSEKQKRVPHVYNYEIKISDFIG